MRFVLINKRKKLRGENMERKSLFILIAILMLFSLMTLGAVSIKDLSPSASGYRAVSDLVEKKIMDIDSNGNFKPSLLVTKLDLARYLYNLIEYYNLETFATQVGSQKTLSTEDLRKLESRISSVEKNIQNIQTNQNELVEIKKRLDSLEKRFSGMDISKDPLVAPLQKDILDLKNKVAELEKQLATLQKSTVKEIRDRLSAVETKVQTIEKYYADIMTESSKNTSLRMEFESVKSDVRKTTDIMNSKIDSFEKTLNSLLQDYVSKTNVLSSDLSRLAGRVNALEQSISKINNLENEIKNIKNQVDQRLAKIEEITNKTDDFSKRLEAVDAITVANTFNNLQLLANRFDQLESRLSNLERKDTLLTETLINEINGIKTENKDEFTKIQASVSEIKSKQDIAMEQFLADKKEIENLKNELNTTRWIAVIGLSLAVLLSIILAFQ